jgi:hypothetical protein
VVSLKAHHSFAADYFEDQRVSVEGDLVEFEYRAPHSWVHLMVKDERGDLQKYSAEWASPTRLKQRGVAADSLKPGDHIVISGSPGRKPAERRIHLKTITRPTDGWAWSGPNTPR